MSVTQDSVVTAWREMAACHAAACAALERELGERHGLVERCGCAGDRRGIYVVLTEAGEQRHAEAAPTHRGVLERTLPAAMLTRANNQPG